MNSLIPDSVIKKLDIDRSSYVFRDSLLLCSGHASQETQTVISEVLLNAANRAVVDGERQSTVSVAYFRPCQLVNLKRIHIHSTPSFDFANWDSIRFYDKSTEDSLITFFSQIHLIDKIPNLIVIEQLDRIIGSEREDFLARLHTLTSLFADSLKYLHWRQSSESILSLNTPPSSKLSPCRLLVSCILPTTIWSDQSVLPPNYFPHGLHQACFLIAEDDSHFSLADINKAFEFKLLLKEQELFFSSFLYNADLLRLTQ